MDKPILFHDIDGVIFGYYGPAGHLQLRPGVADWLQWVHEHFIVIWLTSWEEKNVRDLMHLLGVERFAGKTRYANWSGYAEKELWLREQMTRLNDTGWLWIDDHIADAFRLEALGIAAENCIRVCPDGPNELVCLKEILNRSLGLIGQERGELGVCQTTPVS